MTDDELIKLSRENLRKSKQGSLCELYDEAFIKGYKLGRPKWHKVADGDLPKEPEFLKNHPDNHRYEWYIVAYVGKPSRALYSFAKKKWFIDYEEMMVGNYFEPIAWCEIPRFEGE